MTVRAKFGTSVLTKFETNITYTTYYIQSCIGIYFNEWYIVPL